VSESFSCFIGFGFSSFSHSLRTVSFPTPDLGRKEEGEENKESSESLNPSASIELTSEVKTTEDEGSGDQGDQEEEGGSSKGKRKRNNYEARVLPPKDYLVSRAMTPMKGHTAFLTFAVCPSKNSFVQGSGPEDVSKT
jgi:hypothetical protein